jgi:hypothetical protein
MIKEDINNSKELTELLETQGPIQAIFPSNSNLLLSYSPSEEATAELEDFGKGLGRRLHRSQYGPGGNQAK